MRYTRGSTMKKIAASLLCLLCTASFVQGEPVGKKDAFWDKLQNQLGKVTPARKQTTQGIPGGVRGAKSDEANDIYWKGKDKAIDMADGELQKFSLAIDAKLKGDNDQALKLFEEFLVMYPESSFRVEGLQAAEKIRLEIAGAKGSPASPAPEQQAVPQPVKAEPAPPSTGALPGDSGLAPAKQ